jgi:hypothetical protein
MLRRLMPLSVSLAVLFAACSSTGAPTYYLWSAENAHMRTAYPPVACNSLNTLEKFARLYANRTFGDEQEEATLLGESKVYASDDPPDPPCERVGHATGPINTPEPIDQVKDITVLDNGVASFKWSAGPRPAGQYFTFTEYLVSAENPRKF